MVSTWRFNEELTGIDANGDSARSDSPFWKFRCARHSGPHAIEVDVPSVLLRRKPVDPQLRQPPRDETVISREMVSVYESFDLTFTVSKEDSFAYFEVLEAKLSGKPPAVVSQLAPELAFMTKDELRKIVTTDLEDIDKVFAAEAAKPTFIACAGALEGVLFDVLDRRGDLAEAEMRKPTDWPDRASLKRMVEIAAKYDLLTKTAEPFAVSLIDHRDLVHPFRASAANIHVDMTTAETMIQLLKLVIRDLARAAKDGKIDAYVNR